MFWDKDKEQNRDKLISVFLNELKNKSITIAIKAFFGKGQFRDGIEDGEMS